MVDNNRRTTLSLIGTDFAGVVLLATVALAAGLLVNQFRDTRLPLVYEPKEARLEKAVASIAASGARPQKKSGTVLPETVSIEQLQKFISEKQGLLFDARPEIFHRLGHIPGALSLPRDDFENAYRSFQAQLEIDKGQPIILYCSSSSCEDSRLVQKSLVALGFTNVAVFSGGWAEWEQAGLPQEAKQ